MLVHQRVNYNNLTVLLHWHDGYSGNPPQMTEPFRLFFLPQSLGSCEYAMNTGMSEGNEWKYTSKDQDA